MIDPVRFRFLLGLSQYNPLLIFRQPHLEVRGLEPLTYALQRHRSPD